MTSIIVLAASGILSMFGGIFRWKRLVLPIVLTGCIVAFAVNPVWVHAAYGDLLTGMLAFDKYSVSFSSAMILLTAGILIISRYYYREHIEHLSDIYALMLFSLSGGIILVSYTNLVMLFLGIEILSIPLYILATSNRFNLLSNEAGLKYFLMGSFATCFLLLGITLIYGYAESFRLEDIASYIQANAGNLPVLFSAGVLLVLSAFIFKIAAFPFHLWAPDVYEGSPTVITAFMATVVKTAAFGALIRFLSACLMQETGLWQSVISVVAVCTMITGNIIALKQDKLKRLLAYSGIANTGYVLIALTGMQDQTYVYVLYYMIAYSIATLLAFSVYIAVKEHNGLETFDGLKGLYAENKMLTLTLGLAMLSLAGIPPLAGFFGKYSVFADAVSTGHIWLVVIAVLNSLAGMYYYLHVLSTALQPSEHIQRIKLPFNYNAVFFAGSLALLLTGIFPQWILHFL